MTPPNATQGESLFRKLEKDIKNSFLKDLPQKFKPSIKIGLGPKTGSRITPAGIKKMNVIAKDSADTVIAKSGFSKEDVDVKAGVFERNGKPVFRVEVLPVIEIQPMSQDESFLDAARFIREQMLLNQSTDAFKNIRENLAIWNTRVKLPVPIIPIEIGKRIIKDKALIEAIVIWISKVNTDKDWDYKSNKSVLKKEIYKKGNFVTDHEEGKFRYGIDIWGNLHYGYLGIAAGFSEPMLLKGAGFAQAVSNAIQLIRRIKDLEEQAKDAKRLIDGFKRAIKSLDIAKFDPPEDELSINAGIKLWKSKGKNIGVEDLIQTLRALPSSDSKRAAP